MGSYKKPLKMINGHIETILPYLFRPTKHQKYIRERIDTEDGDFLDIDWATDKESSDSLVILSHGLESSSSSKYILGIADLLKSKNYDVLAWNNRSCSGEMNKTIKYYHSGSSYDLARVVEYINSNYKYKNIYLIGFSLGGNQTLKYLGEEYSKEHKNIKGACVFSTPCCLRTSSYKLKKGFNKIYTNTFLKTLKLKVNAKKDLLEKNGFDTRQVKSLKCLPDFDDYFTAPLHGFEDANDYYKKSSSKYFIKDIRVKTLIVNALNDPFLSPECYPHEEVAKNPNVELETPDSGGHVGFYIPSRSNILWSEMRALDFISNC